MWLEVEQFDEPHLCRHIVPRRASTERWLPKTLLRRCMRAKEAKVTDLRGVRSRKTFEKWAAPELKPEWLSNLALRSRPKQTSQPHLSRA